MNMRSEEINYICNNINVIKQQYRKEMLEKIILVSDIDHNKIYEKGGGIQIRIEDIPRELITPISTYIKRKIALDAPSIMSK